MESWTQNVIDFLSKNEDSSIAAYVIDWIFLLGVLCLLIYIIVKFYLLKKESNNDKFMSSIINNGYDVFWDNETYIKEKNKKFDELIHYSYNIELNHKKRFLTLHEQEKFLEERLMEVENLLIELETKSEEAEQFRFNELSKQIDNAFFHMLDVKEVYGLDHYSFININEYLKQILTEVKNDYSKKLQIISKGIKGERNVESHLLNLKETNEIDFWNGVYLEVENNTFETDFLLFSNKGLFSIEVKNIGGGNSYDLHVSSDGQWRKVYKNGKEEVIQDIVSQSNYHITLTQKLINKYKRETGIEIPLVEPIFAIGNDDVKLENDSTLLIFRGSYIVHYIRKQSVIINDDVINDFKKWLEQFVVPERTYPIKDYSFLLNNIANFLKTNDTDLTYYENKVEGISNDIIHNQYKKIPKDLKKEFNLK